MTKKCSVVQKVLSEIERTSTIVQGTVIQNDHDTILLFHGTNKNFLKVQIYSLIRSLLSHGRNLLSHSPNLHLLTAQTYYSTAKVYFSTVEFNISEFQYLKKQNIQSLLQDSVVRVILWLKFSTNG